MACTEFDKIFKSPWSAFNAIERRCQCILEEPPGETTSIVVNRDEDNEPPPESSCVDWRALQSSNWQTRRDAVTRLGLCGCDADGRVEPEVLIALRAAFKDEHWRVRRQSAFALQELGEVAVHEALPVLWQACMDQDACVRTAALLVLQMYGEDAPSRGAQLAQAVVPGQSDEQEARLEAVHEDDGSQEVEDLTACDLEDIALLSRLQDPALSRATDMFVEEEEEAWLELESHTGFSEKGKTGTQTTEEGIGSRADTEGNWSRTDTEPIWSETRTDTEESSPATWEFLSRTELPKRWSNSGLVTRAAGDDNEPILDSSMECAEDVGTSRCGFKMSLVKQSSIKLGITLELGHQNFLKVVTVEEGSVSQWNQTQSPESQLQSGDRIIAVNGMSGDSKRLLKGMESSCEVLEVIFEKTHATKVEMDVSSPAKLVTRQQCCEQTNLKVSSLALRKDGMQTVMQQPVLIRSSQKDHGVPKDTILSEYNESPLSRKGTPSAARAVKARSMQPLQHMAEL